MRYEDASGTGAFQGQGPIANDDTDQLAAGAKSSATGNLITGEGTQSGSVGADSATDGHITAIAGKGGEDSNFSGGKLSVMGEYGKLSVDADGNYVYQANKGVENVRDRFTYTLADNQGASDTASLIVEIGKTPLAIRADAQQIVVGPDGVVTLPAGVELSDVHVVGRNLVVDMPDGTQLIILDGAVFVPQLVLGGVEVPATNVAALLVGQEVQPAAGETPPSSGGNFAVPPPPLDPGVPLGDLIPPTEYNYVPPEPQEVFDILNEEPEIFIQPDGQPAAVNALDSVDEKGLPARNEGEPEGSGEEAAAGADGDPSEATGGTIVINSPDGIDSLTITGADGIPHEIFVGLVVQGAYGALTITGTAGNNFTYSYLLDDNISHNDVNPDQDDFGVTLTDNDGDQASATLTIDIIDDVPTARPDTDTVGVGGFLATGNVITDAAPGDFEDTDTNAADTVGADDARVTFIDSVNAAPGANVPDGSFVDIAGEHGTLRMFSNGDYLYTRSPESGGGVTDVFNYTLTDGDGDPSITTLTITIPDTPIATPFSIGNVLDDDAQPGGNPGGPEDDGGSDFIEGDVSATGGDGGLTYSLRDSGAPDGYTYELAPNGDLLIKQDGNLVITVTLDPASGHFTITQEAPIDHPTLDGEPGDDVENNVEFNITVRATDADGDFAEGTGLLVVDDDTPEVTQAVIGGTVDEDGLDGGNAGGVNDVPGAETVVTGDVSDLFSPGADQPLTFSLLTDTSGLRQDLTSNGNPVTYLVVGNTLTASADGSPVFTLVLNEATGEYTFTLLDQLDHPSLDGETGDDTENPTDQDLTIALGSIIQATDHDGDSIPAPADGLIITVDDDSPEEFEECPDDVIAVNDAGSTFTGDLNLPPVGADEPGTVAFVVEDGDPVLDTDGHPVSSNGEELFYFVNDDGVLEAHAGDETGDLIFTITINGDGTFTYDQIGDITSTTTLSIVDLSSVGGGNVDAKAIDVPDQPFDLILSTQPGKTVNTNSTEMGVGGGQSLSAGDHIRVDLVQNAFVTGSGGGAVLNFGEYYTANGYRQDVSGLNPVQTADFIVRAVVVNEAGGSNPADPADGDNTFYGDANDAFLAGTTLNLYDDAGVLVDPADYAGLGIAVTAVAGGWQVTGLPDNYDFEILSDTAFNAVQIEAIAGTDTFKLGFIDLTTTVQTEVDMSVPVSLTDSDGDSVYCDIDINLGPPTNTPDVLIVVDEAALPVIGSDPGSTAETQSGNLADIVTGGVGPYTFALVGGGAGTHGTLTLNPDGTYSYTLTSPVDSQPDANDGTNIEGAVETFTYQATDANDNVFEGTIRVNVIDDVPTAVADVDSVSDGGPLVADGNVLTASGGSDANGTDGVLDVKGADQAAAVTEVSFGLNTVAAGSPIAGQYGSLTLNANGSYTYTLNPADPDYDDIIALDSGESTTEVFTYTMVDGDGDESETTLTITINGRNDPPTGEAGAAVVSEEGLSGATTGIPDSSPAGDDTNSASDLDGDLNFTDVDGEPVIYTLGTPAGSFFDADGNPVSWVLSNGNHTLTGSSSAGTVITITIDGNTGEYDVVLARGMDHGNDGNIESEFNIVVPVTVSDGTANVPTTITVQVEDDKPDVTGSTESPAPLLEVDDTTLNQNDTASFAAQFNVQFGGDGPLNPLDEAEYALGINAGATGIFDTLSGQQVQLKVVSGVVHGYVTLSGIDTDVFTVSVNDDGEVTLDQIRAVVHEDALGDPSDAPETLAAANLITLTATAFDADGDFDSHTINIGTTLRFADDHPSIDVAATDNPANKVLTQDADTIGAGVQDSATTTVAFNGAFSIASAIPGNDGPAAINPGAHGNYALSLAPGYVEGTATTMLSHGVAIRIYIDASGNITGSTAASEGLIDDTNRIFTLSVSNAAGHEGEVTLTQYQQVDHPIAADPTPSEAPFADQELLLPNSLVRLTFSATLEDGDGDVASDNAFIDLGGNVGFQDHGPIANNDSDALAPGNVGIADGNVLTGVGGSDTFGADGVADNVGADVPGRISQIAFGATTLAITDGGSQVINGTFGQLTIFSNGNYSYDRFDDSPGGGSDVFTYTLRDFDGDTDTATLTINIGINPPVASAATAKVDDDGLTGVGQFAANPDGSNDINANDGTETGAGIGNEAIYTGSLATSVSGGDGDVDFRLVEPADGASIGQETVNYSLTDIAGVQTLTATIATSPAGRVGTVLFTVTLVKETGAYTVELKDNVLHPDIVADDENGTTVTAGINFIATDAGNTDSNAATLTVQFNDDVPTAVADTANQPTENVAFTIDALANDRFGIDGVDMSDATKVVITANATQGVVTYSTVTHLFTYTPNAEAGSSSTADSFTYKIIDADGDVSTATVNITLQPDSTPSATAEVAFVDDDGLSGNALANVNDINANTGGDGDSNANEAIWSGTFNASFGADTPGSFSFANSITGTTAVIGQETVTYTVSGGGTLITANITTTPDSTRMGDPLFTVQITNQATGAYTVTLADNVLHATRDTLADDDTENTTDPTVILPFTATDSGGVDSTTGNLTITFDDDMSSINTVSDATGENVGPTPSAEGDFAFTIGADNNTDFDDISIDPDSVVISINGTPLDSSDITFGEAPSGEDAHTAEYEFSFTYPTGGGATDTRTGTLIFYKDGSVPGHDAGTYEVVLDGPVAGFTILQTGDASTDFVEYNTGGTGSPDVITAQLSDDLFAQFTAFARPNASGNHISTVNGSDAALTAGDLFVAAAGNPQVSESDAGVNGNTMDTGEILDFDLFTVDPGSDTTPPPTPDGFATEMFIQFFQYAGDDIIVNLKLGRDTDADGIPDQFTTRAIMIDEEDVFTSSDSATGTAYAGLVDGLGSQDALVVIQSDDFNAEGEDWVIVGAQIVTDEDGTTGNGIDLDGSLTIDVNGNGVLTDPGDNDGASDRNHDGAFTSNANATLDELDSFSDDTDVSGLKITSIGFVVPSTTDQSVTINFEATVTDADGDSDTAAISVQIGDPPATPLVPFAALSTESSSTSDSNLSNLSFSNDNSKLGGLGNGNGFGNIGNTGITGAMVAASGFAAMSTTSLHSFDQLSGESLMQSHFQQFSTRSSGHDDLGGSQLTAKTFGAETMTLVDAAPLQNSGHGFTSLSSGSHVLDAVLPSHTAPTFNSNVVADHGPAMNFAAPGPVAQAVAMVSAQALQAAGLTGDAHHSGSVHQVIAEVLAQGNAPATIDAVLNAIHGGNGGDAAIANLASPAGHGVPAWDMAMHGTFGPGLDMMMKMGAEMLHHDAVQPAQNG